VVWLVSGSDLKKKKKSVKKKKLVACGWQRQAHALQSGFAGA
jgi:hypothetical protein